MKEVVNLESGVLYSVGVVIYRIEGKDRILIPEDTQMARRLRRYVGGNNPPKGVKSRFCTPSEYKALHASKSHDKGKNQKKPKRVKRGKKGQR